MRRVVAFTALLAASVIAGSASPSDKGAVVVTVGASTLTVGDVERRMRALPPYQLAALGKNHAEIRKALVEKAMVPELLYTEEATRRGAEKSPGVRDRVRDILRQAIESELRDASTTVTPEDVQRYYDANRQRFSTPRRIKLWRILARDEAGARKILADVKGNDLEGVTRWNRAAREESLDKATSMRDGDLGFVTPDGQTEMPQLRVEPALFEAAEKVKDGELVPEPVKEGQGWAVVWRRGSLEPVTRGLAQEAPAIRQILSRQKMQDAVNEIAERLKKDQVRNVSYELLSYVTVDPSGDVGTRQRPGIVPRHRARGPVTPQRDERGLR